MRKNRSFIEEIRHNINTMHLYCHLCKKTKSRGTRKKILRLLGLLEYTPLYRVMYIRSIREQRKEYYEQKISAD